jgi:O-antigen ligase
LKSGGSVRDGSILSTVAITVAVSGFVYMAVEPFIALYIVLGGGIAGLVDGLAKDRRLWRTPPVLALLGAVALLLLSLPFVWKSEADLSGVLVVLPILIAPGLARLFARDQRILSAHAVPLLALTGALASMGGGLFERYVLEVPRAGMGNNPIHFAGLTVILSYVALIGLVTSRSPWRFAYLLAPAASLVVVMITGTRGALLAWIALGALSLPMLLLWLWRDRGFWLVLGLLASVLALAYANFGGGGRAAILFANIEAVLSGGDLLRGDQIRITLYQTAWDLFLASPIVGHGFGQLMEVVNLRLEAMGVSALEHFHSDLADFAVMAGGLGVAAYGLILLSPLLVIFQRREKGVVVGAILLVASYILLGLTNAMFGLLPQTVLYALVLGYLMALGQQRRQDPVDSAGRADTVLADRSEAGAFAGVGEQAAESIAERGQV